MTRAWLLTGSFLLALFHGTAAQDIRPYLSLIERGRVSEVQRGLPSLISRYPDNPDILYLQALLETNGDSSAFLYKLIVDEYPASEYADEAAMKIGEYLYARGLYSQASIQLRSIPIVYPHSEHLQRALDLMVNSYLATGELDTATLYLRRFQARYPDLNYDYGLPDLEEPLEPATTSQVVQLDEQQVRERLSQVQPTPPLPPEPQPWVVQVGAFSRYENALRLKLMLQQNGYNVELSEVASHDRRLYAVRVVRYPDRDLAREVGEELHRKFSLNYMILNRPE